MLSLSQWHSYWIVLLFLIKGAYYKYLLRLSKITLDNKKPYAFIHKGSLYFIVPGKTLNWWGDGNKTTIYSPYGIWSYGS